MLVINGRSSHFCLTPVYSMFYKLVTMRMGYYGLNCGADEIQNDVDLFHRMHWGRDEKGAIEHQSMKSPLADTHEPVRI